MQIGSLELQVLVNDRPVREYGHQGSTYVAGHKGSRFTLKFRNNTAQRVLAMPSIDGLSAIDGQPATGASKGYIVPAYSSVEIKGWKRNLQETADFVFTDRSATSYAAQTHGAQNCGVIAVKVIAEKFIPPPAPPPAPVGIHHHHDHYHDPYWPWWRPWPSIMYTSSTTAQCSTGNMDGMKGSLDLGSVSNSAGPQYTCNINACNTSPGVMAREVDHSKLMSFAANAAETPDFTLGTGYGQVRQDVVSEAPFERGQELATFEIYYSDETSLTAAGVSLDKTAKVSKPVPQAFGGWCSAPGVSV